MGTQFMKEGAPSTSIQVDSGHYKHQGHDSAVAGELVRNQESFSWAVMRVALLLTHSIHTIFLSHQNVINPQYFSLEVTRK